jgi:hypothetical protein
MIECTSEFQSLDPDDATTTMDCLVTENENLRRKLQTLPVIEQAKGILMGRYGISAEAAFQILRRRSQDTNTKLHLVAQTTISDRPAISNQCQGEDLDSSLSCREPASTAAAHLPQRKLRGSVTWSKLSPQPDPPRDA